MAGAPHNFLAVIKVIGVGGGGINAVPVSYTHLTLPTILRV